MGRPRGCESVASGAGGGGGGLFGNDGFCWTGHALFGCLATMVSGIESKYAVAGEPWRWGVPAPSTNRSKPFAGTRLGTLLTCSDDV